MNWKRKLNLILTMTVIMMLTLPLATVRADDPPPCNVYVRDPDAPRDTLKTQGSQENPVEDLDKAFEICDQCTGGGTIHYNYKDGKYTRRKTCGPPELDPTGVLLAQPIVTALLGLLAVGLLAWGLYTRRRLKRLQAH